MTIHEIIQKNMEEFDEKFTWQCLGYMSNVASDMMVKELKSHLLQSQVKSFELLKEDFEGMKIGQNVVINQVVRGKLKEANNDNTHNHTLSQAITLLDTIIQNIKSQMK